LKPDCNFKCAKCLIERLDEPKRIKMVVGSDGKLECVDKFYYLFDMIEARGERRDATVSRVRCAWSKFRELSHILTARGSSLGIIGKVYKACVQAILVYGCENWAMKVEDI